MSKGQLDQFSDLSHLLSAATNVIVSNLVQVSFLIFTLDRVAFAVDDCVLSHNTIFGRIDLDHFELDLSHASSYCEQITLSHWSVGLAEVRGKENVKERACQAFDGIGNGEDGNALGLRSESDTFGD
jgi:hypothetical protein